MLTGDHSIPQPGSQARWEPGTPAASGVALPLQLPHTGAANKQTNTPEPSLSNSSPPNDVITVKQLVSGT